VCGLCGNNNGDVKDDFTTRYSSVAAGALEFGNSWKTSQECSDTVTQSFPCDSNPYCKAWAVRKCEILRDSTFRDCHSKVAPLCSELPACAGGRGDFSQRLMCCALPRLTPPLTMMLALRKPVRVMWRANTLASALLSPCTQRRVMRLESVSPGESQTSVVSKVHMFSEDVIGQNYFDKLISHLRKTYVLKHRKGYKSTLICL
jgi:hypothetical protein